METIHLHASKEYNIEGGGCSSNPRTPTDAFSHHCSRWYSHRTRNHTDTYRTFCDDVDDTPSEHFVGLYIFRMGPSIRHIVGTCPVCDAPVILQEASAPDLWIRCDGCAEPLHPKLLDDASPEDNNS